jgi:RNA polymerase sigma-70 factor (ECF subfamily)
MLTDDRESWDETVSRARAGDSSAIARLFQSHGSHLHRFVHDNLDPSLNARVSASDVLQDSYLDVQHQIGRYLQQPRVPLHVWLRGVVAQRLMKIRRFHFRAARRSIARERGRGASLADTLAGQIIANDSSPSEQIARRELQHVVRLALSRLRPLDRKIIIWRQFEGWSNSDVAQALGITPSAASMRYARALCRLQERIEPRCETRCAGQ